MALGGGTFQFQNKVLPGVYINFVSLSRASVDMADRGYAALPLEMKWGPEDTIITLEQADFQKNSLDILGYDYTAPELQQLREIMKNAKTLYLYRLTKNPVKATNKWATALYGGSRGNDIVIRIQRNVDQSSKWDVITMISDNVVDIQTVTTAEELKANKFVTFKTSEALDTHNGLQLAGGTDGDAITGNEYQKFLDKIESYYINTLTTTSDNDTIKELFVAFTKRMRDEVGSKFQTILYRKEADYEGIVSLENKVLNQEKETLGVLWLAGVLGSCEINKSITNKKYDGEYTFEFKENQTALAKGKLKGQLLFHLVHEEPRVLSDINTFVTWRKDKNEDFSKNQTIRVIDQVAVDIANLFNKRYLGLTPNDKAGRTDLWKDIVVHHENLQKVRAIEGFTDKDVVVEMGEKKDAVLITDTIVPINAMEKLYMNVIIG
ncbi:phage tail sheath C-terminal domain-containing protein [Sneathia sanguinegens]|uniref:phage tail sheath C-terminal domain-containing protein n=1 Tax=Sneathia sanguinegens TaxID=40543 RepID=UPI00258A05D0|nr:phage tail sheath C-terminal domain-containing protein [Sneathia sanguinegens]MDU4652608.1 phage tail sheath C-terminal domain-containing protein [Sneathia sanguinegens]